MNRKNNIIKKGASKNGKIISYQLFPYYISTNTKIYGPPRSWGRQSTFLPWQFSGPINRETYGRTSRSHRSSSLTSRPCVSVRVCRPSVLFQRNNTHFHPNCWRDATQHSIAFVLSELAIRRSKFRRQKTWLEFRFWRVLTSLTFDSRAGGPRDKFLMSLLQRSFSIGGVEKTYGNLAISQKSHNKRNLLF